MNHLACDEKYGTLVSMSAITQNQPRTRFWSVAGLLLAAAALRLAFLIFYMPGMGAMNWDSDGYLELAQQFREGTWETVRRPPVGVIVCAALQLLPGDTLLWVRFMNVAIDTAVVGLLLWYGTRLAGFQAGLLGGGLYAFYPLAWYRMPFVGTETLHLLLLTGLLVLWDRLEPKTSKLRWFASGIGYGILTLLKQLYKYFPALLVGYWLWRACPLRTSYILRIFLWFLAAALTIGPWTYRNYRITGEFILVDAGIPGLNMFVGNYVPSQGRWEGELRPLWESRINEIYQMNSNVSVKQLEKELMRQTFLHIRENFWDWLPLIPKKAFRFWFISASETFIPQTIAIQIFFMAAAGFGAYRRPDLLPKMILPGLMVLYSWGLCTLSYSCIRFSMGAMPWLCLMGGWILSRSLNPSVCEIADGVPAHQS